MTSLAPIGVMPRETLPQLIDKATAALDAARTSAEVLEARDMARVAYDAAKSAGRIAKAKQAHDTLIVEVHRSQAHALAIRARAEMRLAEEYDAAQERGEVSKQGAHVADGNMKTSDLGIRRDEIHAARKLRDAEREEPVYKRRQDLSDHERAWNVAQLRKSAHARLEHADALAAEGVMRGAA